MGDCFRDLRLAFSVFTRPMIQPKTGLMQLKCWWRLISKDISLPIIKHFLITVLKVVVPTVIGRNMRQDKNILSILISSTATCYSKIYL